MYNFKTKLDELNSLRNVYGLTLKEREERKAELEKQLDVVSKGQMFVQEVAKTVQSQLSSKIDTIVNLGLSSCFPEYSFQMVYESSRNKTEVLFKVFNNGVEIDPMNQCGGGLVNVLELGLRLAVYSISKVNNVMIIDEGFKFISKSLKPKLAELLHTLSEKLDIQFIEVTHIEEFAESADKRFEIKKINGISEVVV